MSNEDNYFKMFKQYVNGNVKFITREERHKWLTRFNSRGWSITYKDYVLLEPDEFTRQHREKTYHMRNKYYENNPDKNEERLAKMKEYNHKLKLKKQQEKLD